MWHEARKQEKKIRGMMVDYKRRAERRRDYYEKIKQDPAQFLQVHGRPAKVHLDPAVALAADSPATMMPWQGHADNLIDRFDVRAHLDLIPEYKAPVEAPKVSYDEEDRKTCYERYRTLVQNDFLGVNEDKFLHQIFMEERFGIFKPGYEEEKKRLAEKKVAIGYVYEDSTESPPRTNKIPEEEDEENDEDKEDDLSDLDLDVTVDVSCLTPTQCAEMNAQSTKYGMVDDDFITYLMQDKEEAEQLRLAKEIEEEKAMYSGRKSRRERRALREKKLAGRKITSPPSYAARDSPTYTPMRHSTSKSRSRSPPDAGKIMFITSFGGEGSDAEQNAKSADKNSHSGSKHGKNSSSKNKENSTSVFGPQLPSKNDGEKQGSKNSISSDSSRSSSRAKRKESKNYRSHSHRKSKRSRSRSRSSSVSSKKSRSKSKKHSKKARSTSRSRSASYSRSRSRSAARSRSTKAKSRSKSPTRSRSTKTKSRSKSPTRSRSTKTKSRSKSPTRSRSTKTKSRSKSPTRSRSTKTKSRSRSRSKSTAPKTNADKSASPQLPPPPIKSYYRHSLSRSNSEISDDSEEDKMSNKSTSLSTVPTTSRLQQLMGKAPPSTKTKLTPQERLKRKMQLQLKKQYKADKKAQMEKTEKLLQERQDRAEELREMAIKLRQRERERRHRMRGYGYDSDSDTTWTRNPDYNPRSSDSHHSSHRNDQSSSGSDSSPSSSEERSPPSKSYSSRRRSHTKSPPRSTRRSPVHDKHHSPPHRSSRRSPARHSPRRSPHRSYRRSPGRNSYGNRDSRRSSPRRRSPSRSPSHRPSRHYRHNHSRSRSKSPVSRPYSAKPLVDY